MKQTARLASALNYDFAEPALLRQALTHRSHSSPHNERLEFLGDSVLNCTVAALLYQQFNSKREGDLSRMRATLVRKETLAEIAVDLDLGEYLRLGEGELKSGGFRRPSILADTLEAVFGAIYLDGSFESAFEVIAKLYQSRIENIDPAAGKDAKTALQEWLQARRIAVPHYQLVATRGESHAQEFEVLCVIESLGVAASGISTSRRAAEQQAAQAALKSLPEKA